MHKFQHSKRETAQPPPLTDSLSRILSTHLRLGFLWLLGQAAATENPARQGIECCVLGTANPRRGRAKLRAAKRMRDMIFFAESRYVKKIFDLFI